MQRRRGVRTGRLEMRVWERQCVCPHGWAELSLVVVPPLPLPLRYLYHWGGLV